MQVENTAKLRFLLPPLMNKVIKVIMKNIE